MKRCLIFEEFIKEGYYFTAIEQTTRIIRIFGFPTILSEQHTAQRTKSKLNNEGLRQNSEMFRILD